MLSFVYYFMLFTAPILFIHVFINEIQELNVECCLCAGVSVWRLCVLYRIDLFVCSMSHIYEMHGLAFLVSLARYDRNHSNATRISVSAICCV